MVEGPTLVYFPLPGRAEIARLAFTLGKINFVVSLTFAAHPHHEVAQQEVGAQICCMPLVTQDKRVTPEEWAALKATTPFGQIPVLEVGGHHIAQSAAIGGWHATLH